MSHFITANGFTRRSSSLPGGLSQAECDRRRDPLAELDGQQLWDACPESAQAGIASGFVQRCGDDMRDAVLDAQDGGGAAGAAEALIGQRLWRAWLEHRDRALRNLCRAGRIAPVPPSPQI